MLDQMGVILAGLKIEEAKHVEESYFDNGDIQHDQPGWALKQSGRLLQVVGTKKTSLGERIGRESDSALATPLPTQK